ncbi:outer membrane lipoprotein-sorting protein [Methylothermus subterraneus]
MEIAQEMDRRDLGWNTVRADLTMILTDRQGEISTRQIRFFGREGTEDGDQSLLVFDQPLDVKDTQFLSLSHKQGDDDQWLYLPALKRVKRIAAANKGGAFMGSEFSYEDMGAPEIEKYTYKYLGEESYQTRPSFVIERYPKDEHSLYSRQVAWIDKELYIPWKVEYYNRRGEHLKTLFYRKYKKYLDKYWRPGEMEMVNHRSGKATKLIWTNYRFQDPVVGDDLFTPQKLGQTAS